MKPSRLRDTKSLTLLLLIAVMTGSCGKLGSHFDSSVYRLPWPTSGLNETLDGELSFQNIEIHTLSDPEHFSGSMARILVEPGDGGNALVGQNPVGRFVRTHDGILIPSDFVTMQAVTAYAHQERLHDLDQRAGAGSVLSWPLSIGIEVKLTSYGQESKNNAVYDAKLNSLLLVPYDDGALPISLNPGVLAHEHFHFIFQNIVMSRVPDGATQTNCSGAVVNLSSSPAVSPAVPAEKKTFPSREAGDFGPPNEDQVEKTAAAIPPKIYNTYVLRGMNEGFADFWGWLYSQDDEFLSKSLPNQNYMRRLDSDAGRLPSEGLIRRMLVDVPSHPDAILPEMVRAHNAYSLGTVYARYLRHIVIALVQGGMSPDQARFTVAKALMSTLPLIADQVSLNYSTGFLSPNLILAPLLAKLPSLSASVCIGLEDVRASETNYVKPVSCQGFDIPVSPDLIDAPSPREAGGKK